VPRIFPVVSGLLLASITLVGCGSEPSSVPFKPTDTSNLDQMKDSMTKHLKTKNYGDKGAK